MRLAAVSCTLYSCLLVLLGIPPDFVVCGSRWDWKDADAVCSGIRAGRCYCGVTCSYSMGVVLTAGAVQLVVGFFCATQQHCILSVC